MNIIKHIFSVTPSGQEKKIKEIRLPSAFQFSVTPNTILLAQ